MIEEGEVTETKPDVDSVDVDETRPSIAEIDVIGTDVEES